MQGDGKFHNAQVRTKVPAVVGQDGDQPFPYFGGQLFEFGGGELLYLLGGMNTFEYVRHNQRVALRVRPVPCFGAQAA